MQCMVRTQIYITQKEQAALSTLAQQRKKTKSELIRLAIDEYIDRSDSSKNLSKLRQAKGIWKDLEIDLRSLRSEWGRF